MEPHTREGIVKELSELLTQGNAHVTLAEACANVPAHLLNEHVPDLPYTLWQLAEHIRIAQWDIVEFCLNPEHESPQWPEGYWPAPDAQGDETGWQQTLAHISQDQKRFLELLRDPAQDLLAPLPHGSGQTLLREALLIGDHTAYHTGQIILVRRLLNNWE
ncbi:DinB family protein [Hymenobacter sp. HSC-4F20]|uniref:DinB family protein n=1 Tax=Hymenobacter sp. HSC-4F20 TaxID=2864135 RepID=UPI001C738092|nr:DinB family protein [Hymenobacter sp. HSC-4F20]MBX0289093.1 DinB family protein [Hymenobacter sp. HSC-4F20]